MKSLTPSRLALAAAMVTIIFYTLLFLVLGPGTVITRLHSDTLNYLGQAQYLASHGTLAGFSFGEGFEPVVYASVAAYIRAPIFWFFQSFDTAIRAIQIQNAILLLILGFVWRQYLILRAPAHALLWSALPFAFLCLAYTPWIANAYLPAGDHLTSLLTMGFVVVCLQSERWAAVPRKRLLYGSLLFALLALATLQKVTSLALLAFAALHFAPTAKLSRRAWMVILAGGALTALAFLAVTHALVAHYITAGTAAYFTGQSPQIVAGRTLLSAFASAIPSQIIPNWQYVFAIADAPSFSLDPRQARWEWLPFILCGVAVSAVILRGAFLSRKTLAAELIFLAAVFPAYAISSNATARYFAITQPFFWLLFMRGMPVSSHHLARISQAMSLRLLTAALAVLALLAAGFLITRGTWSKSFSFARAASFIEDVNSAFAGGRTYLQSIDTGETLLLPSDLRWHVVNGAQYVPEDRAMERACNGYSVYLPLTCDRRNCSMAKTRVDGIKARLSGADWEAAYDQQNNAAEIIFWRMRPKPLACKELVK
jgi:hypothetical protein